MSNQKSFEEWWEQDSGWGGEMLAEGHLAKAAWEASKQSTQWIPVSERLPEPRQEVLVFCDGSECAGIAWKHTGEGWCVPEPQAVGADSITYWQPLPRPPE